MRVIILLFYYDHTNNIYSIGSFNLFSYSQVMFLQVVAYLMVTSIAATMEIYYLAYNGAKEDSWSQACSSYGKFCSKVKLALILHMITFGCFFVLAIISAFRAFSVFDPPSVNSQEVYEDRH